MKYQKEKAMKKDIIGLVGKPGSGKSYIAEIIAREYKYDWICVDKLGYEILDKNKEKISFAFGKEILDQNGLINRSKLAKIAFSSEENRYKLHKLVHPPIFQEIYQILKTPRKKVIDAALLFEIHLDILCSDVWFVEAPFECRLRRVKSRNWTKEDLKKREQYFLSDDELKQRSDKVFFNVGPIEETERTLRGLMK